MALLLRAIKAHTERSGLRENPGADEAPCGREATMNVSEKPMTKGRSHFKVALAVAVLVLVLWLTGSSFLTFWVTAMVVLVLWVALRSGIRRKPLSAALVNHAYWARVWR